MIVDHGGVSTPSEETSVREIQKLLGHKDLATTALYTKVDTRELAGMLQRCHPRER